jgi:hypothetical protein
MAHDVPGSTRGERDLVKARIKPFSFDAMIATAQTVLYNHLCIVRCSQPHIKSLTPFEQNKRNLQRISLDGQELSRVSLNLPDNLGTLGPGATTLRYCFKCMLSQPQLLSRALSSPKRWIRCPPPKFQEIFDLVTIVVKEEGIVGGFIPEKSRAVPVRTFHKLPQPCARSLNGRLNTRLWFNVCNDTEALTTDPCGMTEEFSSEIIPFLFSGIASAK